MSKDNTISTFDPFQLKSELYSSEEAHFHAYLTSVYEVFHINRIEDYNRLVQMPTQWDAQPFRLTIPSFVFLTKGNSSRSKGLITYEFGENSFFFLPAYEISTYKLIKENTEGFFCYFNMDLLTAEFKLKDLLADFSFLNFNSHPVITISPGLKEEIILPLLKRLEKEYKTGKECRFEILRIYLMALFTELKSFASTSSSFPINSAYHITEQYKKAVSQYFYEKQKVSDYADLLAVTPNHLNKCVKSVTGKSAQDLLSEMILMESKVLLKQTNLSISEIAYQLGWSEISAFARFFKSKTSITPGEYRKMLNPEL